MELAEKLEGAHELDVEALADVIDEVRERVEQGHLSGRQCARLREIVETLPRPGEGAEARARRAGRRVLLRRRWPVEGDYLPSAPTRPRVPRAALPHLVGQVLRARNAFRGERER